ncbi:aldehyde dehydrogenase (NAD+) [Brevibacterium sanguinis]|uniref:Aldehyde dehydrogenase (NAD+) n=2 Tax=Brevibacterium TaxID=1696 RepID=A0A366ILS0_9MICO|nr:MULTISPECIES: aldehyde dehydrogenase family protein [Brevibacterium]RBP65509.1 aldehyde dehydrogenase (NAD+) [Brevibacterium sanguinis]RBP72143.1 aldehyde dehydrogenase (NAD+) [Brevibacterium celere]
MTQTSQTTAGPQFGPDAVFDNLIGGTRRGSEDRTLNRNPSDPADVLGRFARADEAAVRDAIAAARAAAPAWADFPAQQRFTILDTAGTRIAERADDLADLLAREEGKQLTEARGEVLRAAQILKFFAGETIRNTGEIIESVRPGLVAEMTHEPIGVVGVITPWNFPIAIPAWKIAPALAYGNTVVFKPAELVPGSAYALVDILVEAGLPDGVLNLVMGPGRVVGEVLTGSAGVDAITFTGSAAVGQGVIAAAGSAGIRVQCEMGGKNPLVVLGDADLEAAADAAVNGAFYSTGQRCTASSRIIVTSDVHDEFVRLLKERMVQLRVGDARAEGTVIGPVVSESQLEQDLRYIDTARAEGGEVTGGERVDGGTDGYFLSPALVTGTKPGHTINREEVFGPVASVIEVADYDEALAVANDTEFGLSAGIFTSSLKYSSHFKRYAQAGMVMVNAPTAGVDYHVSFGGRKGSSYGPREQARAAREFYTVHKTAYVNAG